MSPDSAVQPATFLVGLEIRDSIGFDWRSGRRGRGLFVNQPVAAGASVLVFGGDLLDRPAMLALADRDHYLQIGSDLFLGPSGEMDDYVNHSCDPSTRVQIHPHGSEASLQAVRDLEPGDEVTFDYASVQLDDPGFSIPRCRCGTAACRGQIQDFSLMRRSEQEALVGAGLCVWYVVEAFGRTSAPRAGDGSDALPATR